MSIGERIYNLRKERNLSQEELANELNVSRQSVSKWETNQATPDFDKIVLLCEFFGITTDELLTGKKDIVKAGELENKSRYAAILGTAVGLYIFSAVALIVSTVIFRAPIIGVSILLTLIAIATGLVVYNSIRYGKKMPKSKKGKEDNKQMNLIFEAVSLIGIVIYFIISFLTKAWYITWVIFLIIPAVNCIIKILFNFNEDDEKEDAVDEQNS